MYEPPVISDAATSLLLTSLPLASAVVTRYAAIFSPLTSALVSTVVELPVASPVRLYVATVTLNLTSVTAVPFVIVAVISVVPSLSVLSLPVAESIFATSVSLDVQVTLLSNALISSPKLSTACVISYVPSAPTDA